MRKNISAAMVGIALTAAAYGFGAAAAQATDHSPQTAHSVSAYPLR